MPMDEKKMPFEYSCPGDRWRIEYAPRLNPDGTIDLIEDGKTDLQEFYNVQADGCDMHLIVSRYLQGDTSVLSRMQGIYADITAFPKTNAELLQKVIDGQRAFDALPKDIKAEFNNDFNQWFSTAGSDDWTKTMSRINQAKNDALDLPVADEAPEPSIEVKK